MTNHFLIALLLMSASCAGTGPRAAARAPNAELASAGAPQATLQVRNELTAASDDLDAAAKRMGIPVTTATMATPLPMDTLTKPAEATCALPPPTSETCHSTCELATRICSDAGSICKLAAQLPGDAWASERCAAWQRSCEAARTRCCDCH